MKVTSLTSKECWYFFAFKTYVMAPRLMRRGSLDISLDTIQMSSFPILWVFQFCLIKRYRWASADNCWNPICFLHKYPRFITTAYKMTSNTARVAVIGLGEISRRPMYTIAWKLTSQARMELWRLRICLKSVLRWWHTTEMNTLEVFGLSQLIRRRRRCCQVSSLRKGIIGH